METRGKRKVGIVARARAQAAARADADREGGAVVRHSMEAQALLEPQVAALAAERASDADLAEIERWLVVTEEAAGRGESLELYDSSFHISVARAAHNPSLVLLVAALTDMIEESRATAWQHPEAAGAALADHRAILDALRAHNPVEARRAMRRHVANNERLARAVAVSA